MIKVLKKAVSIIDIIASNGKISFSDSQKSSELNKFTLSHILTTLKNSGYNELPRGRAHEVDNVKYQRYELVKEYAGTIGIELLFLPTYSPNLIERLWKYLKKKCLYSKYYEKFKDFKQAIIDCLEKQTMEVLQELETLLTCEFQSFKNVELN
ncbi:MAG: Transposase, IS630 family [Candidatus Uhrbacteria bacterium GW2011_GWF2_39_13]|uniref:Transposase, IS630 family n=1 Tax=Candidatus Uhrbacteria bacterium GW2011_GWF2_39_13 TaxID=1618995 RepID=A0A0G0MSW4_9BACT|nr:MAG: Transposase, IS630 family [Candidatus Uhrbacteria bacterium GW2011_GWF2_39_13]